MPEHTHAGLSHERARADEAVGGPLVRSGHKTAGVKSGKATAAARGGVAAGAKRLGDRWREAVGRPLWRSGWCVKRLGDR
eukprot:7208018-Alexandrium_andersonii.AAC.1